MPHLKVRFVSQNPHKVREATSILAAADVEVIPVELPIYELQIENTERLVKDKVMKAFEEVGRPLFVEHTGLYIKQLNGFPGGLTQIFWDKLKANKFAELFGAAEDPAVIAKTVIGYTDALRIYMFEGKVDGRISKVPRGPRSFQWDCIFIPEGYSKTFAQLGPKKNEISMRRIALSEFANFLKKCNSV